MSDGSAPGADIAVHGAEVWVHVRIRAGHLRVFSLQRAAGCLISRAAVHHHLRHSYDLSESGECQNHPDADAAARYRLCSHLMLSCRLRHRFCRGVQLKCRPQGAQALIRLIRVPVRAPTQLQAAAPEASPPGRQSARTASQAHTPAPSRCTAPPPAPTCSKGLHALENISQSKCRMVRH